MKRQIIRNNATCGWERRILPALFLKNKSWHRFWVLFHANCHAEYFLPFNAGILYHIQWVAILPLQKVWIFTNAIKCIFSSIPVSSIPRPRTPSEVQWLSIISTGIAPGSPPLPGAGRSGGRVVRTAVRSGWSGKSGRSAVRRPLRRGVRYSGELLPRFVLTLS